ncbi:unnamed protein product [Heterobilharzia americana]|nr:unnamed protein product [Heterobilharzia americana]
MYQNETSNEAANIIKPFVDSVIETALNEVQKLNVNRIKTDIINDKSFRSDPLYCDIMRIQADDTESIYETSSLDEIPGSWERLHHQNETTEEITAKIILSDNPHPSPNIQWPTIAEFTPELGRKKIEEYIKGWERNENWLYCIDILPKVELKNEVQHKYRVKWSIPCRRAPIPKATASVYFTLIISRIKPKNTVINVYYQIEAFRSKHIPGKTRFSERWIRDVINSKIRLMSYVNF